MRKLQIRYKFYLAVYFISFFDRYSILLFFLLRINKIFLIFLNFFFTYQKRYYIYRSIFDLFVLKSCIIVFDLTLYVNFNELLVLFKLFALQKITSTHNLFVAFFNDCIMITMITIKTERSFFVKTSCFLHYLFSLQVFLQMLLRIVLFVKLHPILVN